MFWNSSKTSKLSKKASSRKLLVETLESRKLCAVDLSDTIDLVRSSRAVKNAEVVAIKTGLPQTVKVNGSISNTRQQDHSFLEKANLRGQYSADVKISYANDRLIQEYSVRSTFSGNTRLDDIELTKLAADVAVAGTYRLAVANGKASRVLSTDWRSSGTTNITVLSGPARGTDYTLTLLATDDREFGDKLSGLTTSEIVGNTVRNAIPLKSSLANWTGDLLDRAEKLRIPNVDLGKALANLNIVTNVFAKPGSKSNEQIYFDLLKSDSVIIGINGESDLLRFAQGGVTSIVGAKFSVDQSWGKVIAKIPIVQDAPLFGGLVTASVGAEASIGVSITLAGVFAADSRGWGLTEGTSASLNLKLEAALTGSVAIVGVEEWSLIGVKVKAGAYVGATLRMAVGSLSASPTNLKDGGILYVTANNVQRGQFTSYLSASMSAEVGAFLKTKITVVGIPVWKKTIEKSWEVYNNDLFFAELSLRD